METVDVELVVTTVSMPLAALIATTLFIGILVGVLGRTVWNFTHWRKSKAKKT